MYDKFALLGLNKSGRTPVSRKPKPVHDVTQPISHDHTRDYEKSLGNSDIMRNGSVKRHTVAVHSGMHARNRDGSPLSGITQTAVANAPDASGRSPLDPTTSKRLHAALPSVGARSRVLLQEKFNVAPGVSHAVGQALAGAAHVHSHVTGAKVMAEGVAFDASHPANIARRRK